MYLSIKQKEKEFPTGIWNYKLK